MVDAMGIGADGDRLTATFAAELAGMGAVDVLELGTLRWERDRPSHHRAWAAPEARYVMSDVTGGTDVDVVADAHDLAAVFGAESFDVVVAVSVWEHLKRPWIAAESVAEVLRPGGRAFVATHHTFPVHGYPSDYTRWTKEGLAELFEHAGLETVHVGYAYPCRIQPPAAVTRWDRSAPAWLNVVGVWERPA